MLHDPEDFAYDGIGNRTAATVNGRESIHTSNTLNQYTQRTVPGALDVRGGALASAHVLVNGVPATRQGDYFHRAVPVDNADAPQHPQIKVRAFGPGIGPGGADLKTGETTGRAYLPQTPETFSHDLDGNLTEDGRWVYTWDAENRLIAMESAPSVPDTAKRKLEFAYDFQGRRIRKRVHDWDGTAYVLADERRYAYDGWNLVAEIVASPTPFVRTYVWGLDLSGTEQGAGGVGGLLAIQENGESHYPAYDGNGNVMALVRGSDGAVSGRYEYGPFGELLEVEEDGIANPFRFSTKFQDAETGLLYYGYRYYQPETGRWLSRDPLGEEAFFTNHTAGMKKREVKRLREESLMPAYLFTRNDPVNSLDRIGLDVIVIIGCPFKESKNVFGHAAISVTGYGTYSWGTHHVDGTPLNDYLAEETKLRRQCLYWIETTPEEDKAMIEAFMAERKKGYSVVKQQTCATAASAAMVEIGVFKNVTASPIMLMRWFELGLSRRQGVKGACFCKNVKGLPLADFNGFTNTQKPPADDEE